MNTNVVSVTYNRTHELKFTTGYLVLEKYHYDFRVTDVADMLLQIGHFDLEVTDVADTDIWEKGEVL